MLSASCCRPLGEGIPGKSSVKLRRRPLGCGVQPPSQPVQRLLRPALGLPGVPGQVRRVVVGEEPGVGPDPVSHRDQARQGHRPAVGKPVGSPVFGDPENLGKRGHQVPPQGVPVGTAGGAGRDILHVTAAGKRSVVPSRDGSQPPSHGVGNAKCGGQDIGEGGGGHRPVGSRGMVLDRNAQPAALQPGRHLGPCPRRLQLECGRSLSQIVKARQERAPQARRVQATPQSQGIPNHRSLRWRKNGLPKFPGDHRDVGHVPEQRMVPGRSAAGIQLGPAGQEPVLSRHLYTPPLNGPHYTRY